MTTTVRTLYRPVGPKELELIVRYPVQQVGARLHTEHWIPAEDLAELNRNIVGLIEVIATFEPTERS
jgi:hypothetical protein